MECSSFFFEGECNDIHMEHYTYLHIDCLGGRIP